MEKDYGWLGGAITKHYGGDDSDLDVMAGGLLEAGVAAAWPWSRCPARRRRRIIPAG